MDTPEKPEGPETPRDTSPGAYLPPKLREKLESTDDGDDWEPKGSSPLPLIVIGVLVLGGATWGFMALKAGADKRKAEQAAIAAQARTDSIAAAQRADSLRALVQDTTAASPTAAAAGGAKPSPSPAATASRTGGASSSASGSGAAPAASSGGPYGLAVATYLFEDRAATEKDRLATATGLPARVVTATDGGATVYRLILGSFDSRSAAQRKANELTTQNLVSQADVVPLSR